MKSLLFLLVLIICTLSINGFLQSKKPKGPTTGDLNVLASARIYSNLAEIVQPLGKLPLEFSAEDWADVRPDSLTLVGTNVNVTQQSITEKKKSLNNVQVYVRAPSSSHTETKFVRATVIDETRGLVKLIDKDVSKEPIFFTPSRDEIVHDTEPPQTKYYVNFTYETTDAVYLSFLRSNLNWKTRYQLNLIEETKAPVLIAMADIRNDGQSKVDIESAELLGGDINLQMQRQSYREHYSMPMYMSGGRSLAGMAGPKAKGPSVSEAEEISGLYVFPINQPFSIDGKTNYLIPMFRPRVTIERYSSIIRHFTSSANGKGTAQRSYRLVSDRFLSRGDCIIREYDRLVGETALPNIAAKDKHEFSIGEDPDIIYKENSTLDSSYVLNTTRPNVPGIQKETHSIYEINLVLKNFKSRPVKVEYEQYFLGQSMKLLTSIANMTQESLKLKYQATIPSNDEKTLVYKVEIVNFTS